MNSAANQKAAARYFKENLRDFAVRGSVAYGLSCLSIKPLIRRIEFWKHYDEHFHAAHCPMAHAGPNQHTTSLSQGHQLSVELHLGAVFALENIVDLSQAPVIVGSRIERDFGLVDRARKVLDVTKCPPGRAAGAAYAGKFGEIHDLEALSVCRLGHVGRPYDATS